ncbi:alginate lyase family protein [Haloarcula salinisoli]|uniref:Heparinase II/III family protein n=1 Tax=Haloarcula salinisoli TaxID=2487746 RepID=A0A8J7YGC9_9EURY|nr:alginate lyase family protein [Halomicroarcula salinisoli]MBX0302883.1 heparinase II/III family protein [Halomicroarcula salinisoli]
MSDVDSRLAQLTDTETMPVLYNTVRNMESEQLLGIADRTLRQLVVPSLPVDTDQWYDRKVPSGLAFAPETVRGNTTTLRRCLGGDDRRRYRERASEAGRGSVTFLNRTVDIGESDGVDWFSSAVLEPPELWALQFHGFEFLSWAYLGHDEPQACPATVEAFSDWLEDWYGADETRIGTDGYLRRGWTPYAVSLRIVHLARFCAWVRNDTGVETLAARILYRNAAFLANHVEYDVGGNHLIENGLALLLAGSLFEEEGTQWTETGIEILVDASDQFLADGGHFERSPMYHVIALSRYLTAVDTLRREGRDVPSELLDVATSGTEFLRQLRPPDGRLPLVNDAVFGEALPVDACLRYADAVGIQSGSVGAASLDASGYYWLGEGEDRMLVDGGQSGPAHLPGHSHNDQFAITFWADGQRLLTDTGTYEYAPTDKRQYSRSVAAHNTVQYGDIEPIPISGSYLLGRRLDPTVREAEGDGVQFFDGRYSRRGRLQTQYSHRRRIYHDEDWWLVWDTVDASESAPVTSRLHVQPGIDVATETDSTQPRFELAAADGNTDDPLASLVPLGADSATVATSQYFPEFRRAETRPKLSMTAEGRSVQFGWLLSRRPRRSVAVEHDGETVTGVSIDDRYRSLPATE